ncbi:MAG: AzlD domain-containing protein [Gammaproteobacteria bacterium]|nr:AzlD domain-containing protein [Gammaproteobacteria bacterium]
MVAGVFDHRHRRSHGNSPVLGSGARGYPHARCAAGAALSSVARARRRNRGGRHVRDRVRPTAAVGPPARHSVGGHHGVPRRATTRCRVIEPYVWWVILAITAATLVTRSGPHLLRAKLRIPPSFDAALRFAPACALAAIIAPDLVFTGDTLNLTWENPRWVAGLVAAVIFATSRSMIATIIGGIATFWVLKAWLVG